MPFIPWIIDEKKLGTDGLPKSKGQTRHQAVTKAHTEARVSQCSAFWSIRLRVGHSSQRHLGWERRVGPGLGVFYVQVT